MTLLPAAIRLMALLITVAAGLVEGVTETTTPRVRFQLGSGRCRQSALAERGTQRPVCRAPESDVFGKFIFNAPHAGFTDGKFR